MFRRIGSLVGKWFTRSASKTVTQSARQGGDRVVQASLLAGGAGLAADEVLNHGEIREEIVEAVTGGEEKPVIIKNEEGQPMVYRRERDEAGRLNYVPTGMTPEQWDRALAQHRRSEKATPDWPERMMGWMGLDQMGSASTIGLLGGALVAALGLGGAFGGNATAGSSLLGTIGGVVKWVITFALAGLGIALVAGIAKGLFNRSDDDTEPTTPSRVMTQRNPVRDFAPSRDQYLQPRTRDEAIDIASHIELTEESGEPAIAAHLRPEHDISRG